MLDDCLACLRDTPQDAQSLFSGELTTSSMTSKACIRNIFGDNTEHSAVCDDVLHGFLPKLSQSCKMNITDGATVQDKNPFEFANCSLLDVITNHFCSSLIVNHNKISHNSKQ